MLLLHLFSLLGFALSESLFPQDVRIPVSGLSPPPLDREVDFNFPAQPVRRQDYLRVLFRSLMDVEDDIRAHQVLNLIKSSARGSLMALPEVLLTSLIICLKF